MTGERSGDDSSILPGEPAQADTSPTEHERKVAEYEEEDGPTSGNGDIPDDDDGA